MKKQGIKLTSKVLTGLVLLTGITALPTKAIEVKTATVDVNAASVKAKVYELNGHYYAKLVADKEVANVVARITTETKAEFVLKKELIKAGEEVVVELDMTAKAPTRKLPNTGVKREGFTTVDKVGKHTFNIDVRYEIATEEVKEKQKELKPVNPNPVDSKKQATLDQLAEKREVTAEQKAKEEAEAKKAAEEKAAADAKLKQEAEAKAKVVKEAEAKKAAETKATEDAKLKQEAEAKAKAEKEVEAKKAAELKAKQEADAKAKAAKEAEAKQTTTVAGGLPEVTAAELADPAMNGLTPHTKKMKVALAKKFGITSFSLFRAGDDDGTGHGHNSGMAVDFMVPVNSAQGDQLAEYLTKHMDELGVYYIIWKQRFYMPQQNIYGPANTWNIMPNRGGVTANHYDHVHVSFKK